MASAIRVIFFDLGDTLVRVPKIWLPGAQALLAALKQGGVRLGIISNTTGLLNRRAILDLLPDDFDINQFDSSLVLFSSEVGIDKPDKGIFEAAVVAANVLASQCVYCSENIVETLVAQHVGMHSIRVQASPNSDLVSIEQALSTFQSLISP